MGLLVQLTWQGNLFQMESLYNVSWPFWMQKNGGILLWAAAAQVIRHNEGYLTNMETPP